MSRRTCIRQLPQWGVVETVTWVKCCWECDGTLQFDSYLSNALLRVSWPTYTGHLPEWSVIESCKWRTSIRLLPEWSVIESCKWRTSIRLLTEWSVTEGCKDVLLLDCYLSEILLRVSWRTCIWQLPERGAEQRGQKESRHAGKRLEDVHDGERHDLVTHTTFTITTAAVRTEHSTVNTETLDINLHYGHAEHCQHWDVRHQFTLRTYLHSTTGFVLLLWLGMARSTHIETIIIHIILDPRFLQGWSDRTDRNNMTPSRNFAQHIIQ